MRGQMTERPVKVKEKRGIREWYYITVSQTQAA